MINSHKTYIKTLLSVLICISASAQEIPKLGDNKAWLSTYNTQQTQKAAIEKATALQKAQTLGLPLKYKSSTGQTMELIRFENDIPIYFCTNNSVSAATISSNKVYPGGTSGLSLTGSGITLAEWDEGAILGTHQELTGRVTQVDGVTTTSAHSTHVAGTMISSGLVATSKGMSYQAKLNAYDWTNNLSEISTTNTVVSNHSYGSVTGWYNSGASGWYWFGDVNVSSVEDYQFGFYSSESQNWDQLLFNKPSHLAVKAAGNDRGSGPAAGTSHNYWNPAIGNWAVSTAVRNLDGGLTGYNTVTDASNAKNVLTVGAVDDLPNGYSSPSTVVMSSFSGWGPTDDGRIKPDVVANGINLFSCYNSANNAYINMSGTSMATPSVSGSLGLLLQHEKNLYGANNFRASTLKALTIHTADDAGALGPDYKFGWGLMNTSTAANVISEHASSCNHIKEFDLASGNTIELLVKKGVSQNLKVTICWTDPAGTPTAPSLNPSTKMLVNDLDMRVTNTSTNAVFSPFVLGGLSNPSSIASNGDNSVDNVEQIIVTETNAAVYKIRINHKGALSGGNQIVSVIITGNKGEINTMNLKNITVNSGDVKNYSYPTLYTSSFTTLSGSRVSLTAQQSITFDQVTSLGNGSVVSTILTKNCSLTSNARKEDAADVSTIDNTSFDAKVKELVASEIVYAYPNPISSGFLNFSKTAINFTLVNTSGIEVSQGTNVDKINIDGLPKGLYLLIIDGKAMKVVIE